MNIAEVARLAGVSSAAVSRYFNNGYVSEEKREAIRRVVEETGYRPSLQAQTLRTHRTRMIGVILPRIDSAAVSSMVSGILSVLDDNGYQMLLADTQNNEQKELEYLSLFGEKQVDGVIFIATVFTAAHKKALKAVNLPLVLLGQSLSGCSGVCFDDYHSIYDMTSLLLEKGRRRLVFLSAFHKDKAAGLDRYRGYRDGVMDAGFPELAERYAIAKFSMEGGREAMARLLDTWGEPDGVVCATDTMAIGAMQELKKRGIGVPETVLVAGHGDSVTGTVTSPTLTTIHYSYEEAGTLAAQLLLERMGNGELPSREIKLGYSLVERGSSAG